MLSALLTFILPRSPILQKNDYTSDYTDHCTRGYNVEQAGTRKIAMRLKIKNITNNVAHYETAKNTNL
ncbi:hypothetical protein E8C82_08850 [Escherichia coli]|nr:hypothetical protein [Escherichia coli]KDX91026.1 hypothetical protein AC99_2776 [Escherichia coli 2-222-05_S4_C2]EFC4104990.1 hypothetical protein [Escherichia coli]EFE7849792.1 hypothetical protein [Escherichia coli]MCH7045846.1 hypothetical protein [Escherichia coli]